MRLRDSIGFIRWGMFRCHPEPGPELDSGSIDFGISPSGKMGC